ncbi:MAG: thiamine phosphate synthase [Lachnospirales bacterium]
MYKIAITNRFLCDNLLEKIKNIKNYDYIILREKDLSEKDYYNLSKKAISISNKIILHSFIDVALKLNYKKIHLPYNLFIENINKLKDFEIVGVSTHSLEEAKICEKLGANYITFSHIFKTKCKEGLEPKGLEKLKEVCENVNIPVYALGGIDDENAKDCVNVGAYGVCEMSKAMK